MEYYKRQQINELWQIYMAKCVRVGISKAELPDYYELLEKAKGIGKKQESSQETIQRLIYKINKSNGGDDL